MHHKMAPRTSEGVFDFCRVSAVVRHTAANLGCTIHDRLRVNATAALRGDAIRRLRL